MSQENSADVIEEELRKRLPPDYRSILAHYPQKLLEMNYFDDPQHGGPPDFELLADAKEIVELNRRMRTLWPESDYAAIEFPEEYILIGHDGCGNLYAVDGRIASGCPVFEFDHELGEWTRRANSLDEFAEQLFRMAAELRAKTHKHLLD